MQRISLEVFMLNFLALLCLVSCNQIVQKADASSEALVTSNSGLASSNDQKLAAQAVRTALEEFEKADCTHHPENENCRKIEVTAPLVQPSGDVRQQVIMILEDKTPPDSVFGRYRNRVLGFFDISTAGSYQYVPLIPKARVYKLYDELGAYLANLTGHVPVASIMTSGSTSEFSAIAELSKIEPINYNNYESGAFPHHQEGIFEILADLNPKALFVFVRYPTFGLSEEVFCSYFNPDKRSQFYRYFSDTSISLLDLVKRFGVTHINSSIGLGWLDQIKASAKSVCNIDADQLNDDQWMEILDVERAPFEALKQVPSVLVFKALDNYPQYELDDRSVDYANQCTPYSNFIRVGYLDLPSSKFPKFGRSYSSSLLNKNQQENRKCADLYINGGYKKDNILAPEIDGPKPLMRRVHGLISVPMGGGTGEGDLFSTSLATPLALSYTIYLQEQFYKHYHRYPSLIETKELLNPSDPQPWLLDPLLYDQFELFDT